MKRKLHKWIGILLSFCMILLCGCATLPSENTESELNGTNAQLGKPNAVYGTAGELLSYDPSKANSSLSIDAGVELHDISELLYGLFIEDINFAADGGLYAEMVQNRSFEFTELAAGDALHAWEIDKNVTATVMKNDLTGRLNDNNTSYVLLDHKESSPAGIANAGFLDGMSIIKGKKYDFSVYARGLDGYTGAIYVTLTSGQKVVAEGKIHAISDTWQKYEVTLESDTTDYKNVRLHVYTDAGKVAMDMISLFPQDTYKNRKNGLRADLCEKLEALNPAFLRFPGGCVVEGVNLEKAYNWKDSIGADANGDPYLFADTYGDVAARKMGQNIWTNEAVSDDPYPSFMTYGLGFYEYFLLAEDIGAIGVPVINCGLSCMIQSNGMGPEIGTEEFERYIQDALDLVEFCRGDASTKWGAVRSAMGHPEKFELKYVGIGNEQWGSSYFKNYNAFVDAFSKAKQERPEIYEGIELIFSSGADDAQGGGSAYRKSFTEAYKWLGEHPDKTIIDFAGAIDQHYYNEPEWFLLNTNYYDEEKYSRDPATMTDTRNGGGIPVFLGEYAARSNTLKAALAEAAYMTGLERNSDIVVMAAYAPLFGNVTATHWSPDLIWFNNHQSTNSVNYYVQQIFARNVGSKLLQTEFVTPKEGEERFGGKIGLGSWNTAVKYDNIKVVNHTTETVLREALFEKTNELEEWEKVSDGDWRIQDGSLLQTSTVTNTAQYGNTGSMLFWGDENWENYTFTVEATKTDGTEGFLLSFAVGDKDNHFFWNIGGWNNTVSCLQRVKSGVKSDQIAGTNRYFAVETGKTYHLKVVVNHMNIKCYIDDKLYVDYTLKEASNPACYQVVSTGENGDIIIKLVNVTGQEKTFAIHIKGGKKLTGNAIIETVAGNSLADDNILGAKEMVSLKTSEISGLSDQFNYTVSKYSVTVLRIQTKD